MFFALVFILAFGFVFSTLIDILNLRAASPEIPDEFKNTFTQEAYTKAQSYLKTNTFFGIVTSSFSLFTTVIFLGLEGFGKLDLWIRSFVSSEILVGILFVGTIALASSILSLPFSIYSTFVIEEKFGFNRTTPKTFVLDRVKGLLLAIALGTPILALVFWLLNSLGAWAWAYAWLGLTIIQLLLSLIAPTFIMPLFNKFIPLKDGELKSDIENYAKTQNFSLEGIYTMDGSKRSAKSNAFFTGFGKFRRVVFFDTLIEKLKHTELVAVLAHEIGHYKLKHIYKTILVSILSSGFMLFIFSLFQNSEELQKVLGANQISVHVGLTAFTFFYSPISMFISFFSLWLSRKHEFEADAFSLKTYKHKEALIDGLKKLSKDNLSNLTPHPMKVLFDYTHPPVLQRIQRIRTL